jgi:hypothetical protein
MRLGQRASHEDWLDLGRDLTRRGLRAQWLVVSDGAPGLIKAVEELCPEDDRRSRCSAQAAQYHCQIAEAFRTARAGEKGVPGALDEATDPADAERRLRALVAEPGRPYPSAASCVAEVLPALCIHLNYGQSTEYFGELFIKFFGTGFIGGKLAIKFIAFVALDDEVTARGAVTVRIGPRLAFAWASLCDTCFARTS